MNWKALAATLAVGLVGVAAPGAVSAQSGTGSETAEGSESDDSGATTSGSESSESGESTGATSEKSDGGTAKKESSKGESSSNKKKGSKEKGSAEKGKTSGAKRGPGGKKLREDYPGTDPSKKEQMKTDRIEGLQFKEGQNPGKAYDVKIQELETQIDDLKEEVFQSKSRVVLLKETVLGGNLSGSRAMIVHDDRLGNKFTLRRAMYSLDGNRVFNESRDTGKLKSEKFKVYDGSISSGTHNVSILLEYEGSGYGVFNYMKGYDLKITSSCQFDVKPGKATILRVRTVKKGGAFERTMREPGVKCEVEKTDLSKQQVQKKDGGKSKSNKSGGSK